VLSESAIVLLKEMILIQRKFLWSAGNVVNKICCVKWDNAFLLKKLGGLSISNL